jgi:poly-gamma-glutamate capsule biosynthesis protein CapA/YwtB (metallophosphatase superfamily)
MKIPKKRVVLIILVLALSLAGIFAHRAVAPAVKSSTPPSAAQPASNAHSNRIRVLAAGDFIAHDSVNANAKQPDGNYDYLPMMNSFTDIFHESDIRFCNDANLNAGSDYGISGYPTFNSPTQFARDMGREGCNMVNVGTNHSFDRNQDAINASIDAWDKVPNTLAVVGHNRNIAEHDAVHYFMIKGVKFAFLAYTTYLNTDAPAQNNYGVNVYSNDFAAKQVAEAKAANAQVIIASVRWGVEYSGEISASQKQVAQFLADQGVSLILGHGSHVLEPVQQLAGTGGNKTTVWYSLGNFLNTQLPPETLFNGVAVIDYDKQTKQITNMSFLPLYVHYEWSVSDARAQNLAARHDIKMYLLDNTTQSMIDAQQLSTTVQLQRDRMTTTLNTYLKIPLINLKTYQQ